MLLIQLYTVLTSEESLSEVFLYVAEGEARIMPFGIDEWQTAHSSTRILQGDALQSSHSGKVVLEFYDGTIVRMGADTELVLNKILDEPDKDEFELHLKSGDLWVKKPKTMSGASSVLVDMDDIAVKAVGTVFALRKKGSDHQVRVMQGTVSVDVFKFDDERSSVDSFDVGVGQEALIDSVALDDFRQYQRPYVLDALSDVFKNEDWYKWNLNEDAAPTDFSGKGGDTKVISDGFVDVDAPDVPVITSPDTLTFTTKEKTFTIQGTASSDTAQIIVTHKGFGLVDTHVLSQFKLGDEDWSYKVNADLDNLLEGKNTYSVVAVDEVGNKSDAVILTVNYSTLLEEEPAT